MWKVVAVLVILLLGSNLAWMGAYIRQHEEHVHGLLEIVGEHKKVADAVESAFDVITKGIDDAIKWLKEGE